MPGPLAELRGAVEAAAGAVGGTNGSPRPRPTLERPKKAGFGDYATNAAMLLAPAAGRPPRDVAAGLAEELQARLGADLDRVEVAGPGFLNLFLSDRWCVGALAHVLEAGSAFGGGFAAQPERINVEFVSANPTGPMTAAGGRHAAYGDALARLLEFGGHEITREYYVNDFGSQVWRLGASIQARARGEEPPEGGYEGDYVLELARADPERGDRRRRGRRRARRRAAARRHPQVDARHPRRLRRLVLRAHAARGRADEGRRTPSRSSSGSARPTAARARCGCARPPMATTRTASSSARRASTRTSPRTSPTTSTSSSAASTGSSTSGAPTTTATPGACTRRSRRSAADSGTGGWSSSSCSSSTSSSTASATSMSKRRGDFVTLDELIGLIGVDAARFFMLQRSHDTTVDLDLDLAREQTSENPVYYVQYAHARIASILKKAGTPRVTAALAEAPALRRRARSGRAHARQEAARVRRRGRRGGRAARAAPDRRLLRRALADVHGLLPRLPGRRGRGRGRRVLPARAVRRRAADDRALRWICSASARRSSCRAPSRRRRSHFRRSAYAL